MPIDASILAGLRSPKFADPLEQSDKALEVRNRVQQGQVTQQQLAEGDLALQRNKKQIADADALDKAYKDALSVDSTGTPSIDSGKLTSALASGGHGTAIPTVLKGINDFQKSTGELAKLNSEVAEKQADYGGTIGAVAKAANYDPRLFLTKAQFALQSKALNPALVQPYIEHVSQLLQQDPTGETARQAVQQISDHLIAGSPAQQKLLNEGKTADAAASNAKVNATAGAAKLPGEQADSLIKQAEAVAMKASPAEVASQVASVINPQKYSEIYDRTLANARNAVTHQERLAAIRAGSEEVAKREDELNPALASFRRNQTISTEVGKQVALAKLSPDAFGSIPDPRTRMAAETQYEKDSKDYAGKVADAKRIQDFVAAAQSGNKAAPGLIPITELRGLVNRVNRNELEMVGSGAGSLYDRVIGKLGSLTEGQPISPDLLKDTAKIAEVMQKSARRGYEYNIAINNKTHGGKVTPIDLSEPEKGSASRDLSKMSVDELLDLARGPKK